MQEQFIKVCSWMTRLGLSASELLAFAIIHAYTGFKGEYDGSFSWISKWIGTTSGEAARLVQSLVDRGIVYPCTKNGCGEAFRSSYIDGASKRKRAHTGKPSDSARRDNNIDIYINRSIDNSIDNSIDDSIDDSIDKSLNNSIDKSIYDAEIIPASGSAGGAAGQNEKDPRGEHEPPAENDPYHMDESELLEFISPYACVADVPLEELSKRMNERVQRLARKKYIGPDAS